MWRGGRPRPPGRAKLDLMFARSSEARLDVCKVLLSVSKGLRGPFERCLARGDGTWSHWKPGRRITK
ncbi:hypothetical protein SBA1_390013 [Candidatus Sulfotelmatobacter kueseliae]|uniref:Uncharacterized protein n=1 Tax=Candidatus Sulfotelmatobacter kueseliae TaxID=2042962 RepID=A0A2U3KQF5_9BACT|nr:hypothetical protein SBA1_390013 [Candidatus Sulfotelmatobacter kueseliae]